MRRVLVWTAIIACGGTADLLAQRPLDHDAYEIWRSIDDEIISRDGAWVAYALTLQRGDPELRIRAVSGDTEYTVHRGRDPQFSADSRFVVFRIKPLVDSVRAAKRAKKKEDALPQDSLGVIDLATGEIVRVARVRSFRLPEDAGPWVAYHLMRKRASDDSAQTDSTLVEESDSTRAEPKEDAEVGTILVLRNLATGAEHRYTHVTDYRFAENGSRLALALSSRLGEEDGVVVVSLSGDLDSMRVAGGRGTYKSPRFDEDGRQLAFLTDRDEADRKDPRYALYYWHAGSPEARPVAAMGTDGMVEGWTVSEHRAPEFSHSGERLYFGAAPWVEPPTEDTTLEEDRVKVDIWHWQDPYLQPEQLLQADRERKRDYLAVWDVGRNDIVQLADIDLPEVRIEHGGDVDHAIGESELPYRRERSWDFPTYRDLYVVDVRTGERRLMAERQQDRGFVSPDGRYAWWYSREDNGWMTRPTDGGPAVNVTSAIPYPMYNEEHDAPYPAAPYGAELWTSDARWLLIYDRYDMWAVDPRGRVPPRNVTDGVGRCDSVRFRYVRLDREQETVPLDRPILLAAFHYGDKRSGFYRDHITGDRAPEELVFAMRRFSTPTRADDADRLLLTRQSVEEFPDLWVADVDFRSMRRVSHANPQQGEYRWATVELIEWRSANGTPLQGLLYKPDDFDPSRQYPMMVYFYERSSQNLYAHYPPVPHRSVIRPTFYASRGYVVFIPDIVYRIGYPGQSAVDAVLPGVLEVVRRGFIDEDRIGVQGHSWGGYQIAFMITKTNMFRAAAAGAPVANMTSAYGGIRWGSGRSRMFQYEHTQSRLGGSLWEAPLRYIENSPLFWVDRIETPVLIMHNDEDGAVPWEQGIEFFVALRRLGRPAWLVNYNGEPHWPTSYANKRDWNIRLQQYFDHYLMDVAPPRWLAEGIPATEKGRTLGLELVDP